MNKNSIIEHTANHIQKLRKNSDMFQEKDFHIALGKVLIDLKIAKNKDNDILKKLFDLNK